MQADRIRQPGYTTLPAELRWFLPALVFFIACCEFTELLCRRVKALNLDRDPYISPFLREHYPDFLLLRPRFAFFHSASFFTVPNGTPFMYPAPVGVLYQLFYAMPHGGLRVFLGFIVLALAIAGRMFGRALHRRGVAAVAAYGVPLAVLFLSFPVWFEFKQANMEIVVWVLVTGGVVCFLRGRGYSAAACFGLAASMKIYPVAYLGLLLIRRQYRQIAWGLAVALAATVSSLWAVGASIGPTWQRVSEGIDHFRSLFILNKRPEMIFDHSFLSLAKILMHPSPHPERFAPLLTLYLALMCCLGMYLFFFRIWRMPVINQVLFLTVACIFLPPVSFEYTLLHVFVPLGMLTLLAVDLARRGVPMPSGVRPALLCFLVLLAPLSEVSLLHHQLDGQIKALALAVLLVVSFTRPFAYPSMDDGRESHA